MSDELARLAADGSVRTVRMMAALPDAISTIIVSPIARPKPKTTPAAIPGSAAGRTTRSAT